MKILSYAVLVCLLAVTAQAAEYAVLHTGARILAESRQTVGARVRLVTAGGGTIEIPASAVARFEPAETPPSTATNPPSKPAEPEKTLDQLIDEFANRARLHPALVHSVIAAESAYDEDALSPKGAIGLMQLMPQTAAELQVDPHRPEENIRGGVAYLQQMLERYRGRDNQLVLALAAYNAGPGAVDRYNGLPPYNETRAYVRRVLTRFLKLTEKQR